MCYEHMDVLVYEIPTCKLINQDLTLGSITSKTIDSV